MMTVTPIDLNPAEAILAFASYLTTRDEVTTASAAHDSAPMAEAVRDFCAVNGLEPREGFERLDVRFPVPGGIGGGDDPGVSIPKPEDRS
jgi:hypothetical protein